MIAQGFFTTVFNMIGVATQHEHWFKEAEDVEPIVGPLCRMIEQLPKATLKAFEKRANGAMFCAGCVFVAGPDVIAEVRLRKDAKTAREEAKRTGGPARPVNGTGEAAIRNGGPSAGNVGEPPGGNADWSLTLPPPGMQVDF